MKRADTEFARRVGQWTSPPRLTSLMLAMATLTFAACDIFEDSAPTEIRFRLAGDAGKRAEVIYAREFVAGLTELGDTQVQVFNPDTVYHPLPIDTVMNISEARQWFVWVRPLSGDTLAVQASVEVDGRGVYSQSGGIFPGTPWSFVYMYNRLVAEVGEVTF